MGALMSSRTFVGCVVLLVVTWTTQAATQAPPAASTATVFEGARLIVGDGSAAIEDSAFVVERGWITQVGRRGAVQVPAGAARVDLTGKTVIPALVDGHSHIGYQKGVSTSAR